MPYSLFAVGFSRGSHLQPTPRPGTDDDACHLLVCAEGEMTFEHRAKCECSLLARAAVRCDYWYFGCLSREDGHMASPPFWVVKKGTLHLALRCKSD